MPSKPVNFAKVPLPTVPISEGIAQSSKRRMGDSPVGIIFPGGETVRRRPSTGRPDCYSFLRVQQALETGRGMRGGSRDAVASDFRRGPAAQAACRRSLESSSCVSAASAERRASRSHCVMRRECSFTSASSTSRETFSASLGIFVTL